MDDLFVQEPVCKFVGEIQQDLVLEGRLAEEPTLQETVQVFHQTIFSMAFRTQEARVRSGGGMEKLIKQMICLH